jgi:raffinose/stachyose/melibiose transport system substrate-binding protein
MRRILSLSISIILISMLAVGCSSNTSSEESGDITLTILHRWPNAPFKGYFDGVIKEFEEQNPGVKIKVITALNEDYKQKINVIMSNKNSTPDIYFTWVGEYSEKFIRDGKALDLTPYIEEDPEWSSQIMESQLKLFSSNDKVYGVPILTDAKLYFYNKDIFDKLGLEPPKTWDEFINVLKKLKESDIIPLGMGNKAPWVASHYITSFNQQLVPADVLAKDYNPETGEFTDPGYLEALKKLEELIPYINENPNALTHEEERNMFVNGKIAIDGLNTIEMPYIKDAKFEWGTFNLPVVEGAKGNTSAIVGAPEGFMISPTSKHQDVAVKFLKFMTSKEMAEKWVKETNVISPIKGAVNEETASLPIMPEVTQKIEEADTMSIWIDTATDAKVFNPYLSGAQELLNGQKTPEEIMKEVQAAAKTLRESSE